jgi:hypothetical protein
MSNRFCHYHIPHVGKIPTYSFSLKLEHFEILRILAVILKMAAKMTAILK